MPQHGRAPRVVLYVLFALSGFAGLIYESIWSHYLKLFLGHAAYAQTLVLCIFMGGMALGAWLAGRHSARLRRPLLIYAVVEALLGVAALLFDAGFRGAQAWMFDSVIPGLGAPLAIDIAKWSLAAAIILPQSVLLGATFPLMSAGLVRLYPQMPGRALGWLYFTNSLGAAVGVLVSGFVLIDMVGLPGTILSAGLINFGLALSVYGLVRRKNIWALPALVEQPSSAERRVSSVLLWTAGITGAASFFYEIAWVRMLSLVIGAATHSFELMLSAFITGLALGSFYIRGRIDRCEDPPRLLGMIQVVMGALAVLSIHLYMDLFKAMAWWLQAIDRNDSAYVAFTLFAHLLCFLLMLPATFCAGMTLPLITAALMRDGGERAIGRVYAANTLGSILGVLAAVHLVLPLLGLRSVLLAGAALDIGLGVYLLRFSTAGWMQHRRMAVLISLLFAAVAIGVKFDPQVTSSGVFRLGRYLSREPIVFHRDGKTATVDVGQIKKDGFTYIATNGKVDAGLRTIGPPTMDEDTMLLLGVLPLNYAPSARQVAVIGMGSGRTTHVLLHAPSIEQVHTIEIEPAMVQGAQFFGAATEKTFKDPRSIIQIEDAKTYFARSGKKFDLIISEPSNPWVSGVASLFSQEFYQQVQRYLAPGGLFVQWFHLYEIDKPLAATVINAIDASFSDYVIYATNYADIVIVATPSGELPPLSQYVFEEAAFKPLLQRLNINGPADLMIRRGGRAETLRPLMAAQNPRANSDYFPVLDQGAVKSRFLELNATDFIQLYPYSSRLELGTARLAARPTPVSGLAYSELAAGAHDLASYVAWREGRGAAPPADMDPGLKGLYVGLSMIESSCEADDLEFVWLSAMRSLTSQYAVYLDKHAALGLLRRIRGAACYSKLSDTGRQWVDLFAGVSQDDWQQTQRAAEAMVKTQPAGFQGEAFVFAELLLADIKAEGYKKAMNRELKYGRRMPNWFPLIYLRANINF